MNIYLIQQDINTSWDTYDGAVVCAKNEDEARKIHPGEIDLDEWADEDDYWVGFKDIDKIKVTYLGKSNSQKAGVILASYNGD